jgi:hypothetical protein
MLSFSLWLTLFAVGAAMRTQTSLLTRAQDGTPKTYLRDQVFVVVICAMLLPSVGQELSAGRRPYAHESLIVAGWTVLHESLLPLLRGKKLLASPYKARRFRP